MLWVMRDCVHCVMSGRVVDCITDEGWQKRKFRVNKATGQPTIAKLLQKADLPSTNVPFGGVPSSK